VNRKLRIVGLVALATIVLFGLTIIVSVPWLPSGGQSVSAAVKNWFAPAPHATLLVTTDLDCDWKLDGKPRGLLRANESSTLATGFGQHLLEATTPDGKDELRVVVELHKTEQQVAAIVLEPIRQARVEREEAQRRAEQKAEEALRQKREWASRGSWLDTASGLNWANKNIVDDLDYRQAEKYCADFRGGGHADWRLPSGEELRSVHRPRPLQVGGPLWTFGDSSYSDNPVYTRTDGIRAAPSSTKAQALCVRQANSR
jgi:hypothetical protein